MTADLSALIARLEAAKVGGRELDAHVEVAVRGFEAAKTGLSPEHWAVWRASSSGIVGDGATQYASAAVTTSLDSALALAGRVLPGCCPGVARNVHHRDWYSWIGSKDEEGSGDMGNGRSSIPALALVIAILRAKQGEGE